jgi:hypothetical protein
MSHNTLKITLPIVMIAITLLAVPAGATATLFPTKADWTAAVTNIITAPFTGQAESAAYTWYNTSAGLTVGGVNFVGFTGTLGEYNLRVYNPAYDSSLERGSGPALGGGWSPNNLVATLPAGGVYALEVDIATEVKGRNVLITLSSGETYTITSPANSTMSWWGITSDVPITEIKFSATNTMTMIDNFSYAEIPGGEETPEPIGLVLGATGLAAIWLARRLRRLC